MRKVERSAGDNTDVFKQRAFCQPGESHDDEEDILEPNGESLSGKVAGTHFRREKHAENEQVEGNAGAEEPEYEQPDRDDYSGDQHDVAGGEGKGGVYADGEKPQQQEGDFDSDLFFLLQFASTPETPF